MVSFWVYDVGFLVLFSLFVVWFLSSRKKSLSRQGIVFMYRTQFGVRAINYIGDNFKKLLNGLKFVIVGIGFVLMGAMLWMLGQTVAIYLLYPEITKFIKAPPIAPLIPYFPKLFGMQSFFPPFYFTYFVVALAIVAIVHEFSHGIFMKLFKVKIKSTGLVFLGPILGAFVEEEKKGFEKKKKLEQMTILGAGVFANVIFALIFYGLYVAFFFSSFAPAGYVFDSYGISYIPVSSIDGVGVDIGEVDVLLGGQVEDVNLTEITAGGRVYLVDSEMKDFIASPEFRNYTALVIENSAAVRTGIVGAIVMADDVAIKGQDDLRLFLESREPGDVVVFVTEDYGETKSYEVVLGTHPENSSRAYLGVGNGVVDNRGVVRKVFGWFMGFKDSSVYYKPTWDGDFVYFIYHLIWWVMVINLLVALFNMLPLGMLDGGRFFYLAVLSVTGSERFAKISYKVVGYLILLAFLALMFFWFIRIV